MYMNFKGKLFIFVPLRVPCEKSAVPLKVHMYQPYTIPSEFLTFLEKSDDCVSEKKK